MFDHKTAVGEQRDTRNTNQLVLVPSRLGAASDVGCMSFLPVYSCQCQECSGAGIRSPIGSGLCIEPANQNEAYPAGRHSLQRHPISRLTTFCTANATEWVRTAGFRAETLGCPRSGRRGQSMQSQLIIKRTILTMMWPASSQLRNWPQRLARRDWLRKTNFFQSARSD